MWEVVSVERHALPEGMRGVVEVPAPAAACDSHLLRLVGWLAGEPRPVAVELVRDGTAFRRYPVGIPRPDVREVFPGLAGAENAGWRAAASLLAEDTQVDVEVRAVLLRGAAPAPLATIRLRRMPTAQHVELVSVVVPCYRQAHYLGDAIESVLRQTWPQLEVIVVDDGSDDNTPAVAARYPGVQTIRQPNAGLAAARNTGLHAASGEFVVFVDADDRLLPGAVETGVARLRERPDVVLSAGLVRLVDADGEPLPTPPQAVPADPYLALLEGCLIFSPAAVLYRVRELEALGGFDASVSASADYDVYLRAAQAERIDLHDRIVAEYRRHGANMTRDPRLILRAETAVLRRHRDSARAVRGGPHALAEGLRRTRDVHGRELAEEASRAIASGAWRRGAAALAALAAADPASLRAVAPPPLRRRAPDAPARASRPEVGSVSLGDLRRLEPISDEYGFDRGQPIDRYYIERFLAAHAGDIRGDVLEVGDDAYTRRFGGDRVRRVTVLHETEGNPRADVVADLACADEIEGDSFDCVVLTQTLQLVYDVRSALRHVERMLRPGGVVLATVCGVTRVGEDAWSDHWCWSFTPHSAERLFEEAFGRDAVVVEAYGNLLAATAILHGLAAEELNPAELDVVDGRFPVTIAVRAAKPVAPAVAAAARATTPTPTSAKPPLVVAYHRVAELDRDPWASAVSPDRFEAQLEWLSRRGTPVALSDVAAAADGGAPLPSDAFAVTFDDGYAECAQAAAELDSRGIPATFFVPTGALDGRGEYWWDRLEHLLFEPRELPGRLVLDAGGGPREWVLEDGGSPAPYRREWRAWHEPATPREALYVELWTLLRSLDAHDQEVALTTLEQWAGVETPDRATRRRLAPDELVALARLGSVAVGGHTVNHVSLRAVTPERQADEISGCKRDLEHLLGAPVDAFAYPFGQVEDFDDTTIELVRRAGFRSAYANVTDPGPDASPFRLPRLQVHDWNDEELERRVPLRPES